MNAIRALPFALLALVVGGCVRDETRLMAATCEKILAQDARSGIDAFLRDADARLAALEAPRNRFDKLVRDVQDPQAMAYKPALEYCLAQLKLHHTPRTYD